MRSTTYRVSTWDPGDTPKAPWYWNPRYVGLEPWQVRLSLFVLGRLGYVEGHSILVETEDHADDRPRT